MAVNRITDSKREAILKMSTRDVPDEPAQNGYSGDDVKRTMWQPSNEIMTEVNRIVGEVNAEVSAAKINIETASVTIQELVNTAENSVAEAIATINPAIEEAITQNLTLNGLAGSGYVVERKRLISTGGSLTSGAGSLFEVIYAPTVENALVEFLVVDATNGGGASFRIYPYPQYASVGTAFTFSISSNDLSLHVVVFKGDKLRFSLSGYYPNRDYLIKNIYEITTEEV